MTVDSTYDVTNLNGLSDDHQWKRVHVFDNNLQIEPSLAEALEWCAARDARTRRAYRERFVQKMEEKSLELLASGRVPDWYMDAPEDLQAATGTLVNGACIVFCAVVGASLPVLQAASAHQGVH